MPNVPLLIFLSYARADSESFGDSLEAALKKHGLSPWIDGSHREDELRV